MPPLVHLGHYAIFSDRSTSLPRPLASETAKFWRWDDLGPIDLLKAHYVLHSFTPHVHEGYAIGVIEEGVESFLYRGANWAAPSGFLVSVNPDSIHTGHAGVDGGWTYRMLYFNVELTERLLPATRGTPYFPEPLVNDSDMACRFKALHRALENSPLRLERESMFLSVMGGFFKRYAVTGSMREFPEARCDDLSKVRDYVEEHCREDLSLDTLASLAGMSPYYFHRSFTKRFGIPPHRLLINFRLKEARRLMEGGAPISFAALETGFVDQSHFSRQFKRVYGVSPGAFATAVRA
jgi:AraC-like DNA-binding protein